MNKYIVKKIKAENYRNLSQESVFELSPKLNCIFGNNGNGKTNLLELIYYLIKRKSFRTNTSFPQLLSTDSAKPEILIHAIIEEVKNKKILSLSGKINEKEQAWFLENRPLKRKIDGTVVFIGPFDSFHFHNNPSFRRSWFDFSISSFNKEYKTTLSKLNKLIRHRNALLKKRDRNVLGEIKALDENITPCSYKILKMRQDCLVEMNPIIVKIFKEIFSEEHDLKIEIKSHFENLGPQEIKTIMHSNIEKEMMIGHTEKGIHRDDFIFFFDGLNSFEFCSLGQQKMALLSLIFAYIELFRYKVYSYPIVLLDDISGELDRDRWVKLINFLGHKTFQGFISTANESFMNELNKIPCANKITISDGRVI